MSSKRCAKCYNKISSTAARCGNCGRHVSALIAYRWRILCGGALLSGAAISVARLL